jgi:hypothetical protein
VSVAVVDSDSFKGPGEVLALEKRTAEHLAAYVASRAALGLPSTSRLRRGHRGARRGREARKSLIARFPKALVVAGQLIFEEDTAWNAAPQRDGLPHPAPLAARAGVPMIVLPVQLDMKAARANLPANAREAAVLPGTSAAGSS